MSYPGLDVAFALPVCSLAVISRGAVLFIASPVNFCGHGIAMLSTLSPAWAVCRPEPDLIGRLVSIS